METRKIGKKGCHMSERIFTKEQQSAIDTRDKTLLVSAAAGSGKTATLTERIIRSLLDEEHPVGISELLIVTFTNAAVGEMRERIRVALTDAVAKHPENRRLEKQLYLLPSANILTIDAFCNRLLRECAADAGLPPNYRIADKTEGDLLARTMIEDLIESVYDENFTGALTPARFAALADCLTNVRSDEKLGEIFFSLYQKLETTERGVDALADAEKEYETALPIEETRAGKDLLALVKNTLLHYLGAYDARLFSLSEEGSAEADKYIAVLTPERDALAAAASLSTYAALRRALADFPTGARLPAVRKEKKTDALLYAKATRDALKKDLPELSERYFAYTEEEWGVLFSGLHDKVGTLVAFLTLFDGLFRAEKARRGIAEYADIERYVANALWHDGEKTPFAKAVADRFRAVYIDEFQDVSPLQAHIFEAVVKEDNCFFVGDIKQSIYGFRGADPGVFARAKESYPSLDEAKDSPRAAIFMSKNFRSDPGVIDFVNGVFDSAFSLLGETIGYRAEDRLTLGKSGDVPYRKAEILLVELPKKVAADTGEEEPPAARETEAGAVADAVRRLLDTGTKDDGTPVRPSDIAILFRKLSGNAEVYAKALAARGIGCEVPEEKNFFYNAEVLLTLSLLSVIDNPRKDVHLAGLLCSPLFGFTPDELVAVRREGVGRSLYDALKNYVKCHEEFTKGCDFLKTLEHFRDEAEGIGIDRLLSRLYAETGIEALAARNGGTDNLRLFYEYARRFEASSYRGLYGFLHYVEQLIESGAQFEKGGVGEAPDCVRLVTIHKSKGLEYPICFLAEGGATLTDRDASAPVLLDPTLGPVLRLSDPEGLVVLNNPVRALAEENRRRVVCEENLRLLYVALTRARERLFISGRTRKSAEELLELMRIEKECATPYSAVKRKSFLEFILASGSPAHLTVISPAEEAAKVGDVTADVAQSVTENTEEMPAKQSTAPRAEVSIRADEAKFPESDTQTGADRSAANAEADGTKLSDANDRAGGATKESESASEISAKETCASAPDAPSAKLDEGEVQTYLDRFSYRYPDEIFTRIPAKLSVSLLSPAVLDGNEEEEERLLLSSEHEKVKEILGNLQTKIGILPKFIAGTDQKESAKRGIATHHFLQFCDFDLLAKTDADTELDRLLREKYLTREDGRLVRREELALFTKSDLFADLLSAKKIYREFRFHAKLPARDFTTDKELADALGDEVLFIQGVMDAVYIDREGALCLVDYKTDRLPKEALEDEDAAREFLTKKHARQLSYYAAAIEKIFGKYPDRIGIYSLPIGKNIRIIKNYE